MSSTILYTVLLLWIKKAEVFAERLRSFLFSRTSLKRLLMKKACRLRSLQMRHAELSFQSWTRSVARRVNKRFST